MVFVYNGASTFELGFVNEFPQIKSVLWCPGPGQTGFNALGSILTGAVNPSGKTTDTFVADLLATPTANNFGDFTYDNMNEFETGDHPLLAYPMASNFVTDTTSATSLLAMRQANKNLMYTVVNSRAYSDEAIQHGLHKWQIAAIVIDVILALILIALEVLAIRGYKKRRQNA